jgi:hypothetical protein
MAGFDGSSRRGGGTSGPGKGTLVQRSTTAAPGKRTRTESLPPRDEESVVQRRAEVDATNRAAWESSDPQTTASDGVASATESLPHHEQIQASFGAHDVSHVRAQVGGTAATAAQDLGASAFAIGDRVGFASTPDLHTAAHEAAHVVQQSAGVQLEGGIDGGADDPNEQHADRVADEVVAGGSAEALLDAGPRGAGTAVVQRRAEPDGENQTGSPDPTGVARAGVGHATDALPHGETIQRAFGSHDIGSTRAAVGGPAGQAAGAIGAEAYTYGDRVAFAAPPDLHTAAHEAAHVVQQRAGVSVEGGIGSSGDVYERQADAVADAVVGGRSAEPLLGAPTSPSGAAAVQRKEDRELVGTSGDKPGAFGGNTAQAWLYTWGEVLLQRLDGYLKATAFSMPSSFADWKSGSSAEFATAAFAPIAAGTAKGLPRLNLMKILEPDPLEVHVNAGRDAPLKQKENPLEPESPIEPTGDVAWAEPVVAEIGKLVVKRIIESLARLMPRWLAARNQLALSSEGVAKTADRDPHPAEIVPSHPIDPYVATGLEGRVIANLKAYRLANPDQATLGDMQLGKLKKVSYQWLHDQGAWNWIQVTDPPIGVTKEDVAFTLYGDATYAHTMTDAAPMFGITDVTNLVDPASSEYSKKAQTAKQPPKSGDDPSIDAPEQQMQNFGPLPEQVMLAEASKVKPSGIQANEDGRKVILDRMNGAMQLFQQIFKVSETMPRGGYQSLLDDAFKRVQERSNKVADPATSMALIIPYDSQTQAQNDLLMKALNGVTMAVNQYQTFSGWPQSKVATQQVGWLYLKVACLSEQMTAAQQQLEVADQQSKLFPVTVMEMLLAEIRKMLHTEGGKKHGGEADWDSDQKHDDRTNYDEHNKTEAKLRLGLARVRDKLLQNQDGAAEDLKQLAKELIDLQNEVSIVGDLDAMESAWAALYDDISVVGVITGANSDDVDKINGKDALRQLHDEWTQIYALYRSGQKDAAIAKLKERRPVWTELYPKIGKLIKDNQTKNRWVTFGILVGIAVITAGIGAYVEGVAGAAWGAGSWATFFATTGSEAAAFTSMSYFIVEKDPTVGGFFLELGKNFLLFGALKGLTGKYIEFVGKDAAGTVDTMIVQFVAVNTEALVEADAKKYLKTGQHLSMDEVLEISKQNAMFMVAAGIATTAAKPGLEAIKLSAEADVYLARLRGVKTELRDLATQLQNNKNVDVNAANDLILKQRELLRLEEATLQNLEKMSLDPKEAKKAGLDKADVKAQLLEARKAHDQTAAAIRAAEVMQKTEGAGQIRYAEKGKTFDEIRDFWKEKETAGEAKVVELVTDKQFGSRGVEITMIGSDGKPAETFRLLERTATNADAVSKSPQLATHAPTPEQVAANQAAAANAQALTDAQTAAITAKIDALSVPEFERINIGGDAAGVMNQASLPKSAGGAAEPGSVEIPKALTISDKTGTWRDRGPVNQMPGEVAGPGVDPSQMQTGQHDYVSPQALDDAIRLGRYQSGMALYKGRAVGEVEARGKQPEGSEPWASSKNFRIKIVSEHGTKYFYADAIDVSTGPGPSKAIPDKLVVGGTAGAKYQQMVDNQMLVYGDQAPLAIRPGAKRVIVSGGSGNAAATAEALAKAGMDVTWVARVSERGISPAMKPEYDAIVDALGKNPPEALKLELEARKKELEGFSFAESLPRNKAEAFDSDLAKTNIHRIVGDIGGIEPVTGADGKESVKVEINGVAHTFDMLAVSQGQEPTAPGATASLVKGLEFEMILDGDGRLVGLESVNPKGVRLMGSAFADPKMARYVVASEQKAFLEKLDQGAQALPDNSKGVAPSLANASKNIQAANDVLAVKDFKLTGSTTKLVLPAGEEAAWPGKVAVFLGGEMGIDPGRLRVDMVNDGRSGAPVFRVRVGAEELGYFKVFSDADAAVELKMLQKLKDAHLKDLQVVDAKGTAAGADGKTGVLMDTAKGSTITSMIDQLPVDPAARAEAVAKLEAAVKAVAKGLAELHSSFTDGMQSDAQKRSDSVYISNKLDAIRQKLGDAHYQRIKDLLFKISQDYIKSNVPATAYHGDANTGNFLVDSSGKVTTIDVEKMRWSFDQNTGKAAGTGAADVGRFLESLQAKPQLQAAELKALTDAFKEAYFAQMKGKVAPADLEAATLLYQIEFEIAVITNASPDAAKVSDTSTIGAIARLDALLGITGEFKPDVVPPPKPSPDDDKKKKSNMPGVFGQDDAQDDDVDSWFDQ